MKDLRFDEIPASLASSFKSFMLPSAAAHPEFDSLVFYGAVCDDKIAAILVCDLLEFEPELLSLVVSPEYEGEGIAGGLLDFAIASMMDRYGEEAQLSNRFKARVAGTAGHNDKICHILESHGFVLKESGNFYEVPVSALYEHPLLQNSSMLEKISDQKYRSLKECKRSQVNAFGNFIIEEGLSDGLDLNLLDEDISYAAIKDDKIRSAVLFYKEDKKVIQNAFIYKMDNDLVADRDMLSIFTAAASAILRKYTVNTRISFLSEDETTDKVLKRVFPKARVAAIAATYELEFESVLKAAEQRFTQPPVFNMLSNDRMVCGKCSHCTAAVIECDIYSQKPDRVLDGGECPDFHLVMGDNKD